jgi:FlaG/FlaF family flagellin (archaellin)
MKGVSTIIATIIMVVITLGLISVAYLYMAGLITGTTATNIQLADAYCNGTHIIYLIKNIGTASVSSLTFYVDGAHIGTVPPNTGSLSCTPELPIGAGNSTSCIHSTTAGIHNIRVVGPSNVGMGTVDC